MIKKLKLNDRFSEWVVRNPHSKISVVARYVFFLKNFVPKKLSNQKSNVSKKIFWIKKNILISSICLLIVNSFSYF